MSKYLMGGIEKMEQGSSHWYPVTGQERQDKLKHRNSHSNVRKTPSFPYKGGQTLEHVPERGCGVSWRHLKSYWTRSWIADSALTRGSD